MARAGLRRPRPARFSALRCLRLTGSFRGLFSGADICRSGGLRARARGDARGVESRGHSARSRPRKEARRRGLRHFQALVGGAAGRTPDSRPLGFPRLHADRARALGPLVAGVGRAHCPAVRGRQRMGRRDFRQMRKFVQVSLRTRACPRAGGCVRPGSPAFSRGPRRTFVVLARIGRTAAVHRGIVSGAAAPGGKRPRGHVARRHDLRVGHGHAAALVPGGATRGHQQRRSRRRWMSERLGGVGKVDAARRGLVRRIPAGRRRAPVSHRFGRREGDAAAGAGSRHTPGVVVGADAGAPRLRLGRAPPVGN
mmetsp:Transcript_100946/g.290289  ORF Transcript_100946/g.290289 Transcript_100946/m.290289 type:complete len:311 (-) Transcript_100946:766-1698(-)